MITSYTYRGLLRDGGRPRGEGLMLAVNHSGDSDSTGSICGNLLGAERGMAELPGQWAYQVEGLPTISAVAARLADRLDGGTR